MTQPNKELVITLEEAKRLYPTSDETMKKVFESTFGKNHFYTDICDRIQSLFCRLCGGESLDVHIYRAAYSICNAPSTGSKKL